MSRLPVVLSSLLLGALAPAWASGPFDDIDNLAYEHMAGCVTPYVESSLPEQDALLARLVETQAGSGLVERLRDGAPAKWHAYFGDAHEPLEERVQAAVNLVGMAMSQGGRQEKAIARAYSAYYLSAVTQGECPAPTELASFVARTPFWPANAVAPNPSASPIAPIAPNP
ncbi:hypothetical protein [Agrilutibacter solisilvae]|uniref:Uncharacterized protein n=1 Tax=Agrilutibacter solisilvae TaxID=2763317 RepID=A0A974XW88_9GAMM|nr:hypothetical protein [Lysobacter solisilvae]QSX77031.1 hypothetical protein I8J32_009435 [Lysobacter solisilvae]